MTKPGSGLILTLFLSAAMLPGCGGDQANTADRPPATGQTQISNSDTAKTNVEELGMLVHVPYNVEDIVWKQDPSNKSIVAVFRLSHEDSSKLVAGAEKSGPGRAISLPVETWYPDELIAQGEMSGDSTLKGTALPASMFYQDPYNTGRITRVEGIDYFVLEISPK